MPVARGRPAGDHDDAAEARGWLYGRLEAALTCEGPALEELGAAETSVRFRVAGTDAVTLLLDRRPPLLAGGREPAEIVIELTAAQAIRFAAGELSLTTAILEGAVSCRGPVRRYLAVDPLLRGLLAGL
jgi:hypothetical protein